MELTPYHAKYFAHELTRRCPPDSVEKLAGALADAQVDLNPHQVDAALFAFRSPLSKGALLADEVGLGKTIEAGLVLSQKWAERRRRILVITPSNLRKQWYQELTEKFFLPCRILESSYNTAVRQGHFRPFEGTDIVICSYHFAKSKAGDVNNAAWDLVVIDEAHRLRNVDRAAIEREVADLDEFARLAASIQQNAKGTALLKALGIAFAKAAELGAAQKAIIFTESRRTQSYLLRVLADSPYAEGIVLFNGSNTDERSKLIYADWLRCHEGTDRVTGSRTADLRSALVDYFHEQGRIMIATEAGAEGINLQFCSLVVNYDLPWNPQRVEQRIGRCHRYGQQHDVVVVNFLNQKNAADQRVFQLLAEKFQLFEGVFGASDEVLGAIESGVDFEKRIAGIYQRCRKPEEIQAAFDQLQLDLSFEIDESMTRTRQQLLENFDDEVREKLRIQDHDSKAYLGHFERMLMQLTRHELDGHAEFLNDSAFRLNSCPFAVEAPLGLYELPRRSGEAYLYRLTHPLAAAVLAQAKGRSLHPGELVFDYSSHGGRITILEPLVGQAGALDLVLLTVEALNQTEDYVLLVAKTDGGTLLDDDQARRLFTLPGRVGAANAVTETDASHLHAQREQRRESILAHISDRNGVFFQQEMDKLDHWADDVRLSLRRQLKELDEEVTALRRQVRQAGTVPEKVSLQRQVNQLETKRDQAWREYDEAARTVDRQKNDLLDAVERTLQQRVDMTPLFTVRWKLA